MVALVWGMLLESLAWNLSFEICRLGLIDLCTFIWELIFGNFACELKLGYAWLSLANLHVQYRLETFAWRLVALDFGLGHVC